MRCVALAALLPLAGCVGYLRFQADEPVAAAALLSLEPGRASLGDCLGALGAPDHVFEYAGDGMALLWSWRDTDDWSVDLRIPVYERLSASLELDLTDETRQGCVLWFGADLVLERWRAGTLGELLPGRKRPVAVD